MDAAQINRIKAAVRRYVSLCSIELEKEEYLPIHNAQDTVYIIKPKHPKWGEEADSEHYLDFTEIDLKLKAAGEKVQGWAWLNMQVHGVCGNAAEQVAHHICMSGFEGTNKGDEEKLVSRLYEEQVFPAMQDGAKVLGEVENHFRDEANTASGDDINQLRLYQKLLHRFGENFRNTIGREIGPIARAS